MSRRDTWAAVTRHLQLAAQARREAKAEVARLTRPNPRPAGMIQPGGATEAVLRLMRADPKRQWRRAQFVVLTGRSESAIDWALLYLRMQGVVRVCNPEFARHLRYMLEVTP